MATAGIAGGSELRGPLLPPDLALAPGLQGVRPSVCQDCFSRDSEAFTKGPAVVPLELAPSQSFGPILQQHHVVAARPWPYLSDYERAFVFTRLFGTKPSQAMLILGPVVAFVATS